MEIQEEFFNLHQLSRRVGVPYRQLREYVDSYTEVVPCVFHNGRALFASGILADFKAIAAGDTPLARDGYITLSEISRRTGFKHSDLVNLLKLPGNLVPCLNKDRQVWFPELSVVFFQEAANLKIETGETKKSTQKDSDYLNLRLLLRRAERSAVRPKMRLTFSGEPDKVCAHQEGLLTLSDLSRGTGIPYAALKSYLEAFPDVYHSTKHEGLALFQADVLTDLNHLRIGEPPSNKTRYTTLLDISHRSGMTHAGLLKLLKSRLVPCLNGDHQVWFPLEIIAHFKVAAKYNELRTDNIWIEPIDHSSLRLLVKHPELLSALHWRSFEKLLAHLLRELGYEIELQRGTKDGGVDIFAQKEGGAFGLHRYLVQAKRWSKAVGVASVRETLFLHNEHRMTKSCLVTTSRFTAGASKMAEEFRWQLELRDSERLREWLRKALLESSNLEDSGKDV